MDAVQSGRVSTSGWIRWLPGIATLRSYEARWFRHDIAAGLVLTTALAPVGIAYAVASGLPGVCGLCATIVPLLAYALFGPSRILVLGPNSALAAVILGVTAPLATGDVNRAVALAGMMAIVSGAVCILAGVARLGFVTELLSKPIRYGYMNGIALAVLVSQTSKLFGVKVEKAGPLRDIWSIAVEIAGGRMNWTEFTLGAATLAVIFSIKTFKGLPGILVAIAGATAIVQVFDLETRAHVSVLGPLPLGLPAFSIPWVGVQDLATVALGGLAAALVSFADTSVLSRSYAARLGQAVDSESGNDRTRRRKPRRRVFPGISHQQQFVAHSCSGSGGIADAIDRGRRRACRRLLLIAAPRLLQHLPYVALVGVVIASAIGLIEVTGLRRLYRIQR